MNEQEQWNKLGLKLREVAEDAALRAKGKQSMLTVQILVDGEGTPIDWFGPHFTKRITPEQWQAAKDAAANGNETPAGPAEEINDWLEKLDRKRTPVHRPRPRPIANRILREREAKRLAPVELNTTGVAQIEQAVNKAMNAPIGGQDKTVYVPDENWALKMVANTFRNFTMRPATPEELAEMEETGPEPAENEQSETTKN